MAEELGANGPNVAECISEALARLSTPSVRDGGRFTPGNVDAGKDLARSVAFWNAVQSARDAIVARVTADHAQSAPETQQRLFGAYAGASLFRESMEIRLIESGGPITNKGRTKALFKAYLSALDREMKLAQVIGLERKAKRAQSLAEVLEQHEDDAIG